MKSNSLSNDEVFVKSEFIKYIVSNKKESIKKKDLFLIEKAIDFCFTYHRGQYRHSGEPYYIHPIEVAKIICELGLGTKSICASLLHDAIEDTDLTYEQIESNFCTEIANLVQGVTKLKDLDYVPKRKSDAQNFKKFILSVSKDIRILIIKFADRLHNMRTIKYLPKRKQYLKSKDTLDVYVPLASRIGIDKIKNELQNLSLEVIDKDLYEKILQRKTEIKINKDDFVRNTVQKISTLLSNNGVDAQVHGREKSCYSIWMKMMYKDIDFDNISDIFGFRVICADKLDCYKALGVMHLNYKSAPSDKVNFSGFDDYISNPKQNGYRSLHTIVYDDDMKIEIQIRTAEMNTEAEYGMISHWRYKQNKSPTNIHSSADKYSWVEEIISILNVSGGNLEFLDSYVSASGTSSHRSIECIDSKTKNKIYLPHGSNIIDFAYALYPKKAKKLLYAKVNDTITSLSHELKDGSVIEIITTKEDTIDHNWHNIAKTFKAKSFIKRHFLSKDKKFYKYEANNLEKDREYDSDNKNQKLISNKEANNYDYDYLAEEEIKNQPAKHECSIELKMSIDNFFPIGVLRIFEENKISIDKINILEKDKNFIRILMNLESYFPEAFNEIEVKLMSVSCILDSKTVSVT